MNEKDTIITWNEAAELFTSHPDDLNCTRQSAEKFEALISAEPHYGVSKLCYNTALLQRILGDNTKALAYLNLSLEKDPHNGIAYFQRAAVCYHLARYTQAAKDYQKSVACMRQVTVIDYTQLGLRSKLYQHEAIYNEAACHLRLGDLKNCTGALQEVKSLLSKDRSSAPRTIDIDNALQRVQSGATSIDILERGQTQIYTPPVTKLNNLAKKNYLGKAKVVSSLQSGDTFSGFVGPKLVPPDRPEPPRPVTPVQREQNKPSSDDISNKIVSSGEKPEMPDYPPPKPAGKPSPKPRHLVGAGATIPAVQVEDTNSTNSTISAYEVELLSGPLSETIHVSPSTNYHQLKDLVKNALGYDEGTFSLWYMNRQGTYTMIENQEVVQHVWKWKVKDSRVTIYVYGV